MQKGFAAILILGLIAVSILFGATIYLKQKFIPFPGPGDDVADRSSTVSLNKHNNIEQETENWKTYTSDNKDFSFKHPDSIIVEKNQSGTISVRKKSTYSEDYYQIFQISSKETINLNSYKECFDDPSTSQLDEKKFPCYLQTITSSNFKYPKRIDELSDYKTMDIRTMYYGTGRSERIIKTLEAQKVEIIIAYGEGFDEEIENTIDQILSTFKFLDSEINSE